MLRSVLSLSLLTTDLALLGYEAATGIAAWLAAGAVIISLVHSQTAVRDVATRLSGDAG